MKYITLSTIKAKKLLKLIIPPSLRTFIRKWQNRIFNNLDNNFKGQKNSEIFDDIYNNSTWGKSNDGLSISGRGSHSEEILVPYITSITKFLKKIKPTTIVDIGCGDFNVGRNFTNLTKNYLACDVSSVILKRNKKKFSKLDNVHFSKLDISSDNLPKGDVALVRQVLQHLSNEDIKRFVNQINTNNPYKYMIVTEHLPIQQNFKANLNKQSSGPSIRLALQSGVVLHKKPFHLICSSHYNLLEVSEDDGRILTTVYEFKNQN